MILGPGMLDLDRAHQRPRCARHFPVHAVLQAIQQATAVGVATTGRIDQVLSRCQWDLDHLTVSIDGGAPPPRVTITA